MTRHLVLVLGDQLGWDSPALADFDPAQDQLLMIEADSEAGEVWNHQARIAIFLSGMRHFANEAHQRRWPCTYLKLNDTTLPDDFYGRLMLTLKSLQPQALLVLEAGAWRMERLIEKAAEQAQVPLRWVTDTHFLCSRAEFAKWAGDKKELRMEFFYREMRKRHGVLMAGDQFFRQMKFRPDVRLELGSNEAIKESVAGGLGVGVVSRHALHGHQKENGVSVIDVQGFPLPSAWHIVYPAGKKLSPLALAFKQHVLQQIRRRK